ncbi:hypothetical protein DBV15_09140 [Temnothorax longispinosus]|uniref:Uncharacterized protein n=1 Tax=Temnothorax longispinosus TaxID=300112 RepID=A0A4S2KGE7_9HYME|nr:hypothetical protein DBV15_09140 [Temnothorax longispinosus]
METILGIECDARHYGRHEHHPVHQTPSAFYDRQKLLAVKSKLRYLFTRAHGLCRGVLDALSYYHTTITLPCMTSRVIAVPGNVPKRANTRASQLEELALDCWTKEAYNLNTFAHHSMMYSETTRKTKQSPVERNMRRKGGPEGRSWIDRFQTQFQQITDPTSPFVNRKVFLIGNNRQHPAAGLYPPIAEYQIYRVKRRRYTYIGGPRGSVLATRVPITDARTTPQTHYGNESADLGHTSWKRCGGETRRWSAAEERPFRPVSADKNLRVGRTEKEEERKLREAEAIDGREAGWRRIKENEKAALRSTRAKGRVERYCSRKQNLNRTDKENHKFGFELESLVETYLTKTSEFNKENKLNTYVNKSWDPRHASPTEIFLPALSNDRLYYLTDLNGDCWGEGAKGREMKRAAKETRVRAGDLGGGGGDGDAGGGGGSGWWLPATRERGNGMEREREHGGAEVSGKLNLAQDVTAPGNTGASVRLMDVTSTIEAFVQQNLECTSSKFDPSQFDLIRSSRSTVSSITPWSAPKLFSDMNKLIMLRERELRRVYTSGVEMETRDGRRIIFSWHR